MRSELGTVLCFITTTFGQTAHVHPPTNHFSGHCAGVVLPVIALLSVYCQSTVSYCLISIFISFTTWVAHSMWSVKLVQSFARVT